MRSLPSAPLHICPISADDLGLILDPSLRMSSININEQILMALPSKYMQNLSTPHHLHCCHPGPRGICHCLQYYERTHSFISLSVSPTRIYFPSGRGYYRFHLFLSPAQRTVLTYKRYSRNICWIKEYFNYLVYFCTLFCFIE